MAPRGNPRKVLGEFTDIADWVCPCIDLAQKRYRGLRDRLAAEPVLQIRDHGPSRHAFAGTYREIAPHRRLIFEALGATGRVILEEAAGRTPMAVEIECRSAEHLDQFLEMGVDVGTARTLDNLVAYAQRFSISVP